MKDLIKEIEGLKDKGGWTNDSFYHCAINNTIRVLNQHNIITAPKSIKLSEIVEKLKELTRLELSVETALWSEKAIGHYISCWEDYDFDEIVGFDKDMKITHINLGNKDEFKWLYTLWIANVEIIDDMEVKDNEK